MDPARELPRWAKILLFISRPAMIAPITLFVAAWFGSYSIPEVVLAKDIPFFLQGSTDYGGSNIFAATVALYVTFGILGAIYLVLVNRGLTRTGFGTDVGSNVWRLRYHILVFLAGGLMNWTYDEFITPNDFRNIFLFAAAIYTCSILYLTVLIRRRTPLAPSVLAAPLLIYAWLWIGADGNTAKAGQILQSGDDPAFLPRSARHRVMLAWHQTLDRVLGDIPATGTMR